MKTEIEGRALKVPDFFVVGAQKSGTTSLYFYLRQHPDIFMPQIKETDFFSHGGVTFEEYARLFSDAGEGHALGECSPHYLLFYNETIKNMKRYVPDWRGLKIIIVLREPVERAFSQHNMRRMLGRETRGFEEAAGIDEHGRLVRNPMEPPYYIGFGLYFSQVKAFMENFKDVGVWLFDDLKADARGIMREMYSFLGVDAGFVPDTEVEYNPSGIPKLKLLQRLLSKSWSTAFPFLKLVPLPIKAGIINKIMTLNIKGEKAEMRPETREDLKSIFRDDMLKLQDLIKRDLSGWIE